MKVKGEWLSRPATQAVCATLTDGGHQALLVGGCVRNALMGLPVADIDIATDALPQTVIALSEAAGMTCIPTGLAHGTVTVVAQAIPHEVTTFRRDVETSGRHATVAFSSRVEEDAARRDFTMNALYARPDGTVIDPLGALVDVAARRLRFVGNPADRIAEDYLRILRFFRFQAWYADPAQGPDPDAVAACAAQAEGLETLSRERIGSEIRKLLAAPDPAPAVATMACAGVLVRVLPGASADALPALVHLERGILPNWLRRMAVLGGDDPVARLRLSRVEAGALATIRDGIDGNATAAELGYRNGMAVATDIVLTKAAVRGCPLHDDWMEEVATGAQARFPVSAADLMPGLSGAALGEKLASLEEAWIASGFALSRKDLLD